MNLVKGVADLLRRSAGGQSGDGSSWGRGDKLSAPLPKIRLGELGDEAVLNSLWQRYGNAIDKIEKRKLLQVFLMQFIQTYKNWKPENNSQLSSNQWGTEDVVVGCSFGHPSEMILILVQEIARMTSILTEVNSSGIMHNVDHLDRSNLGFSSETLYMLKSLTIITRSVHNCKTFCYYGGVQKVTALMKALVIQLKTLSARLSVDDNLITSDIANVEVLGSMLICVVSILFLFMDLDPDLHEKIEHILSSEVPLIDFHFEIPLTLYKDTVSEARYHWQQRAIIMVMEAGGLNWLVELLRVIRRLNLKDKWSQLPLQYLTVSTIRSTLCQNPRAQNHFRSIGGIEALLDQLALSSGAYSVSHTLPSESLRIMHHFIVSFRLQALCLEALRESIYGNVANLQFLCENGRIQKFATSICSSAFMLHEYLQHVIASPEMDSRHSESHSNSGTSEASTDSKISQKPEYSETDWIECCTRLSSIFCSFLLSSGDSDTQDSQKHMSISFSYLELSIKWFIKVLLAVFPCVKACSSDNELPSHLRVFTNSLQHHTLFAFRRVLVYLPKLLEVFREEGIWEFIFSKNLFYICQGSEEHPIYSDKGEVTQCSSLISKQPSMDIDILQMEAISFVEFAATLAGNAQNLPECSILLKTLETSMCNSDISNVIVKSLHRILQLAVEHTAVAFSTLNAVSRVLKVACVQAQEHGRQGSQCFNECLDSSLELFTEYVSVADNARSLILQNGACVDCLFELFWEARLRRRLLDHILELMKTSFANKASLQYLCSKYLETLASAKENEDFVELSIDLLVGMRDVLQINRKFYQDIFRDGECFLHVVSLLNGTADEKIGEQLVLNVLQTLTFLLSGNDTSKITFRALVGQGYQTLQNLLLDYCRSGPSLGILSSLLDMLVDGNFDTREFSLIKNGDAIMLYLVILQKCSDSLRGYGLDVFLELLKDSMTNRDLCFKAGMLSFLLDWFYLEQDDDIIGKVVQLVQIIGGHSMSGKDIRKIFAILRSDKVGSSQKNCSILLTTVQMMLKEKGPAAFFEFSGHNSGIVIKTPVQWPCNKGFTFSCWIRIEDFAESGVMGLFNFQTENGRGCSATIGRQKLVFESVNQKQQSVALSLNLLQRKWHFLCITHSIGRAFSGGSIIKCYVDGHLVSSEKCRYAKVSDLLTCCSIGAKIPTLDEQRSLPLDDIFPFYGQMGPVYLFSDALSLEQIKGLFFLGPSYMYSFIGNETQGSSSTSSSGGLFDVKDGLSSKITFGLSAQAADGRNLFNVALFPERTLDKNSFQATVMSETRLCSRRLLQEIIYCVGGVSVFFPLLTRLDSYKETFNREFDYMLVRPITSDKLASDVVKLISSVLAQNAANQQQMLLLSGFSVLGFLFQSLPPQQLNMDTVYSLKQLLDVMKGCDFLVKEAVARIYLNPHIWVYVEYEVQRELYMFLIQHFESDASQLTALCCLPRIIDIIRQFYWNIAEPSLAFGVRPLLHPTTGRPIAERPSTIEIHKIRLLLLSLSEMSLKQKIESSDIKALLAFFEKSQDVECIEDILQMVMRAVSHKPVLASFLEQVNLVGSCHMFINLLQRNSEPVRLLGLQFLGKLLIEFPSEKKSQKFFNLSVGRPRSLLESYKKVELVKMHPLYAAISDRLFKFSLSDHLCATLFDVLLGGASPKQVLQKHPSPEQNSGRKSTSHFALPQILVLIFKFLSCCNSRHSRIKILNDLLHLLDSNSSNIEALVEYGWHSWLATSVELDATKIFEVDLEMDLENEGVTSKESEQLLVRNVYCIVLTHYIYSVKGGWQQLEDTVDFLLANSPQAKHTEHNLLPNVFKDLVKSLLEMSSEENIFISQPCRDNAFYLLKLVDERLVNEIDLKLLFPMCIICSECTSDLQPSVNDIRNSIDGNLYDEDAGDLESTTSGVQENLMDEDQWQFYDNIWVLVCELHGKGPSKIPAKSLNTAGPSFGQRARGLVESLNIPAAEMAAVVVSGGIGSALGGKTAKYVDKAMLLRGEKCPRIIFRLLMLYLSRASLERASASIRHFVSLLPSLFNFDDEQYKNRLQLFIWSALVIRSQNGMPDNDVRFDIISHLIVGMVSYGKTILYTLPPDKDESFDSSQKLMDASSFNQLIQKDCVVSAAADEMKYVKALCTDRLRQIQEFRVKMDEHSVASLEQKNMLEDEVKSTISTIISFDDNRRATYQVAYEEDQQIVAEKWVHIFRMLVDERGPWSATPFPNNNIVHWKLDRTEDNWRRRLKLRRNYHFDDKLCYPSLAGSCKEINNSTEDNSLSMKSLPEQMKLFLLKGVRGIPTNEFSEQFRIENDQIIDQTAECSGSLDGKFTTTEEDRKDKTESIQERNFPLPATEMELSKVLMSIPCVLITPKRKIAGQLAVRQTILHFSGLFFVEGTGGSSVFKRFKISGNLETSASLNGIKTQNGQKGFLNFDMDLQNVSGKTTNHETLFEKKNKKLKRHRRWNISKIKSVHWTRYLLQYTAIEIFFSDHVPPIFLNFENQKDAKTVGSLIVSSRNDALFPKGGSKDRTGIIPFIDRQVASEMAEVARETWRRREMSNFEYLMILNTLSGRSYNDITQYPVFPWILADYTSEKLDFNKSSTFRDLSKPVGALNPKRFEVFEDRYHNFADPDIPSFYYGSHYSSMGVVLYFLLRMEPFTALHRNLQGGKFDHADRLFQSVEGTYRNCMSNTSDVKELIPEFFYMPEFLVNLNSYHLGVKQDGEPLGNVSLPPWAKGSPEEFIWRHREALESEYVSSNLHDWIDLVFGYKQRGKPAIEAANVFYYLTYEGAVELDIMDDELQRSAIEDQIANFGQTPIQIFRKKHPRRGMPIPIAHPLHFAPASIALTSIVSNTTLPNSSMVFIGHLDTNIVVVNENLTLTLKMWLTTQLQSGGNFTFSSSQDPFFGIGSDLFLPRKIGIPVADNIDLGPQCFTTLQASGESYLISCGSWDNSFQITSLHDGRTVRSIRQHKDVVSCIAVTSDGGIIASGSYDTTVMLWDASRLMGIEKRMQNMQIESIYRDRFIVENPIHILCGHDDIITCLFVSSELDVVISGSKDGSCIFHTLREGRYVRSIQHPSSCPLTRLVSSQHGRVVIYAEHDLSLHMFSINGKHLAFSDCNGRLNCMVLSPCGEFLVCGGDNGQIVLRSMHSLEIVRRYEGIGKAITSLAVTPEECFLAGAKDGSIILYSVENPQLRKASMPRNLKVKGSTTGGA